MAKSSNKAVHYGNVVYRYIPRKPHGVTEKTHILYKGKLATSIDTMGVLRNQYGKFVIPMTDEESKDIREGLGLSENDLNVNMRDNEFLKNISIELGVDGLRLDLSDPYNRLIDKVLLAYNNFIAPDLKSQTYKASFRYVRVDGEEETDIILADSDSRKKTYKLLGALEESRERMLLYVANSNIRINPRISTRDLRKLVNKSADADNIKFIRTLESEKFSTVGMLRMAVLAGVVDVNAGMHYFDKVSLASENEAATFDNAVNYLLDNNNSQVRIAISKETIDGFSES